MEMSYFCLYRSIYTSQYISFAYFASANCMLRNISNLQFQQIVKHPQIMSVETSNLSKTYTYKFFVKNRQTYFYVLQTCRSFNYIYILYQKIVTAFYYTITSKFSIFSKFIQKLVVK
jgi:hypothetical protein